MKPTLNEEVGMSQEGIDYVNSLEVKFDNEQFSNAVNNACQSFDKLGTSIKLAEKQRIQKQSQKVWSCVFVAIVIIVTYFLNTKN